MTGLPSKAIYGISEYLKGKGRVLTYKIIISDDIVLQKCIEHVIFKEDTTSYYTKYNTNVKNSMIITGKIDTEESTASLYKWALLPGTNPDCYKAITVECYRSNQLIRKVSFSKAFVVSYSENYSNNKGTGIFTLSVRQFAGKEIECIEESAQQADNAVSEIIETMEETVDVIQQTTMINVTPKEKKSVKITDKFNEKEEAKILYLPKSNGKWSGEEGNSEWIPEPQFVPKNPKTNPEQLSWGQILSKYGISGIRFVDGEPDFSPVSKGTVEIKEFSSERDDNFDSADEELAKIRGCTKADVRRWRKKNKYTWHERKDCKTMDKVPTSIHGNITHSGGISEMKKGGE